VRRWTAPRAGLVSIRGRLKHASKDGDGVRGRVILNGSQQLKTWSVHNRRALTRIEPTTVAAGQTIDFVCDLNQSVHNDSFEWRVELTLAGGESKREETFNSRNQFRGPRPAPLDAWEQVAQILLLSNEFQFVD
jgi:hypothetical protein